LMVIVDLGRGDTAVTQLLLHNLERHAGGTEECGVRVTEGVGVSFWLSTLCLGIPAFFRIFSKPWLRPMPGAAKA